MPDIRRVIQYSGMDYERVLELPADIFKLMLKNHIIDELNATKEGRQYLDDCERMSKTDPDEKAILQEIRKQQSVRRG